MPLFLFAWFRQSLKSTSKYKPIRFNNFQNYKSIVSKSEENQTDLSPLILLCKLEADIRQGKFSIKIPNTAEIWKSLNIRKIF